MQYIYIYIILYIYKKCYYVTGKICTMYAKTWTRINKYVTDIHCMQTICNKYAK